MCLGNRGLVTTVSPRLRPVSSEYRFIAIQLASLSEPHRGEGRDQTKNAGRTWQVRGGRHLYMTGRSLSRASCPYVLSLRRSLAPLGKVSLQMAKSKALSYPAPRERGGQITDQYPDPAWTDESMDRDRY